MSSYVLEVTLAHIRPPIWRQLQVPGDMPLAVLHDALQVAFGWEDSHQHEFIVGKTRYGVPDPDGEVELLDETEATVATALPYKSATMQYVYDLGDYWIHNISVDRIETEQAAKGSHRLRPRSRAGAITCLDGKRAGPPEDFGGPHGNAEFLKALADADHPRHTELSDWIGGAFDPEVFSVSEINRGLSALA